MSQVSRFAAFGAAILMGSTVAMAGGSLKDSPPPVVPYTWTGFYTGLNVGYSWGESDTSYSYRNNTTGALLSSGNTTFDMNGWLGGVQLGYNRQISQTLVVGLEADIQITGQDGGSGQTCLPFNPCSASTAIAAIPANAPTSTLNQDLDWFGTLRARLGLLIQPTLMAYVTGGWAFGGVESHGTLNAYAANGALQSSSFSQKNTLSGWVLGGGLEGQISDRWTAKIEYLYMDLGSLSGSATLLTSAPPLRFEYNSDITDQILRIGINYRL